ncbi:hypothetical protein J2Y69_002812 [Microbacterium resistens]|uniref:Uncharacterized protein n=1 Tax=Microbacterium resistens TaxID=156977 RepID=A0ABU1SF13_9MICO|nr:hypothetical protein [Microbacterium resistens]
MARVLDVVDRWPELFARLPDEARRALGQTLASSWHVVE